MRGCVAFNVRVDVSSTETETVAKSFRFSHVDSMLKFAFEEKRSLSRVVQEK